MAQFSWLHWRVVIPMSGDLFGSGKRHPPVHDPEPWFQNVWWHDPSLYLPAVQESQGMHCVGTAF